MKFNNNTKQWDVDPAPEVTNEELHAIVGSTTGISVCSDGTIIFARVLTAKEKTDVEALMLTRKV